MQMGVAVPVRLCSPHMARPALVRGANDCKAVPIDMLDEHSLLIDLDDPLRYDRCGASGLDKEDCVDGTHISHQERFLDSCLKTTEHEMIFAGKERHT